MKFNLEIGFDGMWVAISIAVYIVFRLILELLAKRNDERGE